MAIDDAYITAELQKQTDLISELVDTFTTSLANFEDAATDPGTGFDVDAWLNLVPTPTIVGSTVPDVALPTTNNANTAAPSVVPPTFITPANVASLALSQYDSQYLEDIEQELRASITDIIEQVMPAADTDAFFRSQYAERARAARDGLDLAIDAQARRGFPAVTMQVARASAEVIEKWQADTHKMQDTASGDRLGAAMKHYFAAMKAGVGVEDIRSRVIMSFAKVYSGHNMTLAAYYQQLVSEKIAAAKLALSNYEAELRQAKVNVSIQSLDNREEIALPQEVYKRAVARVETEFKNDAEVIERRRDVMQKICETYANWAIGSLEQGQGHLTAKFTTE